MQKAGLTPKKNLDDCPSSSCIRIFLCITQADLGVAPFPLKSNDKVGSHIPKDDCHGCKDENHVGQGKKAFKVREVDEVEEIENAQCGDEGRQVAKEHIFCKIRNKDAV